MAYFIYLVECSDGSLYCGYTNDLSKRVKNHNEGKVGAKYTKTRRPVVLKYFEEFSILSDALKREHAIKKLSSSEKRALFK